MDPTYGDVKPVNVSHMLALHKSLSENTVLSEFKTSVDATTYLDDTTRLRIAKSISILTVQYDDVKRFAGTVSHFSAKISDIAANFAVRSEIIGTPPAGAANQRWIDELTVTRRRIYLVRIPTSLFQLAHIEHFTILQTINTTISALMILLSNEAIIDQKLTELEGLLVSAEEKRKTAAQHESNVRIRLTYL
jgi:hypothetical protein